jgi:glutaminase
MAPRSSSSTVSARSDLPAGFTLFDGGARSADVVADEKVICYGLEVEQLKELAVAHPNIMVTILASLTRDFSERLRHANEAIRSLE